MGLIVVLGESVRAQGYALAGAKTIAAETAVDVLRAWEALDDTVTLVVLTPLAAEALGDAVLARTHAPLVVAMAP